MAEATAVKERPILFSGEMVKAILDGRKTQTRRPIKPQYACKTVSWGCISGQGFGFIFTGHDVVVKCPLGTIGDRLWVRETFRIESFGAGVAQIRYAADSQRGNNAGVSDRKLPNRLGGVPSIHMPRHCSRIALEITDVRVERLNDMTEEDAVAEGFALNGCGGEGPACTFHRLWDSIYGCKRCGNHGICGHSCDSSYDCPECTKGIGTSWRANPWVWAISFRKV